MHFIFLGVFINRVTKNLFISMCLTTHQKYPIKNDKPIKAYKVVATTPNKNFFGVLLWGPIRYKAPFYSIFDYTRFIRFHHTVSGPIPEAIANVVNQGFHLYLDIEAAKYVIKHYDFYSRWVIFECEIPTGSKYFVSDDNAEICTNRFKFIKELKI